MIPIKTDDVIVYKGQPHLVRHIQMTREGPILSIIPVGDGMKTVHFDEITLARTDEKKYRMKAIASNEIYEPVTSNKRLTLRLNNDVDIDKVKAALEKIGVVESE